LVSKSKIVLAVLIILTITVVAGALYYFSMQGEDEVIEETYSDVGETFYKSYR
jgi:flagellar basal body-associated protein FliL